jgi:hypothetical protein
MTTNTGQRGKRAGEKKDEAGRLEQDSLGRTVRSGQPEKTGQSRQVSPDGST